MNPCDDYLAPPRTTLIPPDNTASRLADLDHEVASLNNKLNAALDMLRRMEGYVIQLTQRGSPCSCVESRVRPH